VLRKHNGPMKPRELVAATKLSIHALRRRLNDLEESGQVTVTGATMNRQVSLGRARAAKEVP